MSVCFKDVPITDDSQISSKQGQRSRCKALGCLPPFTPTAVSADGDCAEERGDRSHEQNNDSPRHHDHHELRGGWYI